PAGAIAERAARVELHAAVLRLAEIRRDAGAAVAARNRRDRPRFICLDGRARLPRLRAHEDGGRVRIEVPRDLRRVRVDAIDADEPVREQLVLETERGLLCARVLQLARIEAQLRDVKEPAVV